MNNSETSCVFEWRMILSSFRLNDWDQEMTTSPAPSEHLQNCWGIEPTNGRNWKGSGCRGNWWLAWRCEIPWQTGNRAIKLHLSYLGSNALSLFQCAGSQHTRCVWQKDKVEHVYSDYAEVFQSAGTKNKKHRHVHGAHTFPHLKQKSESLEAKRGGSVEMRGFLNEAEL